MGNPYRDMEYLAEAGCGFAALFVLLLVIIALVVLS